MAKEKNMSQIGSPHSKRKTNNANSEESNIERNVFFSHYLLIFNAI